MPRHLTAIERSRDVFDGRAGYRIRAEWGHVAILEGGGHICELALNCVPGINPLWTPPWKTIDAERYSPAKHRRVYGPPPDGRLLAGIAGHSLSFDHFGPPSPEETAAGLSTHGEAPSARWRLTERDEKQLRLTYGCRLRAAQIEFSRTLSLDRRNPVIYCEERARNLSPYDRPISWNEHVTFGPPFLESNATIFDMPATRAKVCPPNFSDKIFLQPDREFTWPRAPRKDAGQADLRTTPDEVFGHYTAQLLDPALDVAFVSASNPRQRLLVVYAFPRADFPWVGNWEERNSRPAPPWNGRTFCRGIEFSTTPFAIPRRETVDQGPLFEEPTFRWLPGGSTRKVRFAIMLFQVPEDFAGVKQLTIERGRAMIAGRESPGRQLSVRIRDFF